MMKIFIATILLLSINTAISQGDLNPCGKPGNLCNIACISENQTASTDADKKGYCGTSPTRASTATTGCLCPNGEIAEDDQINNICMKAIEQCRVECGDDELADCARPYSSETDSECVCSGGP